MNNEDQIENDVKTEGPKVHLGRERDEMDMVKSRVLKKFLPLIPFEEFEFK